MEPQLNVGLGSFMAQTDALSRIILAALILMSIATWYLIIWKTVQTRVNRRRSEAFLARFWNAPSLQAVQKDIEKQQADEPFSRLTLSAITAAQHHERHGASRLNEAGSASEFATRAMRRSMDEDTARLESGLTVLASVGSVAPFIGLFGTVWGIYHALVAIGISGSGTLDKVAGPVGEALIMTALGLAVAIPAVLAYNVSVRSNRLVLARLDSFAHDVFAFLSTGSRFEEPTARSPGSLPISAGHAPDAARRGRS